MSIRTALIVMAWLSVACAWAALLNRASSFDRGVMVHEHGNARSPVMWLHRSGDGRLVMLHNVTDGYTVGYSFGFDGKSYTVIERWPYKRDRWSVYAEVSKPKKVKP